MWYQVLNPAQRKRRFRRHSAKEKQAGSEQPVAEVAAVAEAAKRADVTNWVIQPFPVEQPSWCRCYKTFFFFVTDVRAK
jgi:hypothetical protein